jgi:segregation and condensation protein B
MKEEKLAILEALIFASETPLTPERAADVLTDMEKKEILPLFEELGREYETRGGGILLVQVAGGFQFRTRPEMATWIRKLKSARPAMLSPAALETLAVVAYRQPLVKSEIDRIRGVDVSGALKGLLEKKLVRIVGRKDVPGKPIIYGTTKRFLEVFNLKDLSELPTLRDLKDLQDDSGGPILGGGNDLRGDDGEPTLRDLKDLQGDDTFKDLSALPTPKSEDDPQRDDALKDFCETPTLPNVKDMQDDGSERQE